MASAAKISRHSRHQERTPTVFSRPAQPLQLPSLPLFSPDVPCRSLVVLSAALSVLEHRHHASKDTQQTRASFAVVPSAGFTFVELCFELGLPVAVSLDSEQQTLPIAADFVVVVDRW